MNNLEDIPLGKLIEFKKNGNNKQKILHIRKGQCININYFLIFNSTNKK